MSIIETSSYIWQGGKQLYLRCLKEGSCVVWCKEEGNCVVYKEERQLLCGKMRKKTVLCGKENTTACRVIKSKGKLCVATAGRNSVV